jgi:hypothetical protein
MDAGDLERRLAKLEKDYRKIGWALAIQAIASVLVGFATIVRVFGPGRAFHAFE